MQTVYKYYAYRFKSLLLNHQVFLICNQQFFQQTKAEAAFVFAA